MSLSTRGHSHDRNPRSCLFQRFIPPFSPHPPQLPPLLPSVLLNLSYHTSFLLFLLSNIVSFTAFTSFLPLAIHFTLQNQSLSEHWVSLACLQLQSRLSIFYIKKLFPLDSFLPWRQRWRGWLPTKLRGATSQKTVSEVLKVETNLHKLYTPGLIPVLITKLAIHQSMWIKSCLICFWVREYHMSNLVCASKQQWADRFQFGPLNWGGGIRYHNTINKIHELLDTNLNLE